MNLERIQDALQKEGLDGWLFFDHHGRDPLAYRILGLRPPSHVTRRWYYLVRAKGEPAALVHRVEPNMLSGLPGRTLQYAGWQEHRSRLGEMLKGLRRIAMQYSPFCAIPYVALVDAGTIELVRSSGCEVISSAELVQQFEATLSREGVESHLEAGKRVDTVRAAAFQFIAERIRSNAAVTEFETAEFVRGKFAALNLIAENGPIVGVNRNAANPHYEPSLSHSASIMQGDFVLLDMWAKLHQNDSVYYDITWTGYCGTDIPERISEVFSVVRDARNAAVHRVKTGYANHDDLRGFDVDDAARNYIRTRGFGENFIHRTGHSIGHDIHGNGANIDNFEIHDERRLIPWTCFSIEPGVYLDTFGVRSELNMILTDSEAMVTGEAQAELVRIV